MRCADCGRAMPRKGVFKDGSLIGRRFGRLKVIRSLRRYGQYQHRMLCKCSCGRRAKVVRYELLAGSTTSCGCFQREDIAKRSIGNDHGQTHGMSHTNTYSSWKAMRSRCLRPKDKYFHRYGGIGITVCPAWRNSFEAFLADMGERPEGTTLGRFADSGNYEPGNCAWMTAKQQGTEKSKAMAVAA